MLDQSLRFMRQEMLERYQGQQDFLSNTTIAVLGTGGMGGLCSLLLALAGVGKLKIADGDTVAIHNLHRQILFSQADLNLSKAQSAARTIQAHNSDVQVEVFSEMITKENFSTFIQGADLLLDLTDNSLSRLAISKLALEHNIDLISGAVSGYRAILGIFAYASKDFVRQCGCYRCLTHGDYIETKVGITGPIASSASALVSHIVLEYLLGDKKLVGKVLHYDFANIAIQKFNLVRDLQCPDCQSLVQ